MEAMSSGCCIVASDTPPVKEMIQTGKQGQLVNFFDPDALAQQVENLLQNKEQRRLLGESARMHVIEGGYDLKSALKQQVQLLKEVIRG